MNAITDPQPTLATALRSPGGVHPQAAAGITSDAGIGKLIHSLIYMPNWLQVAIILGGATLVLVLWRLDSRNQFDTETGGPETNGKLHVIYRALMVLITLMVIVTLLAVFADTYLITVGKTF